VFDDIIRNIEQWSQENNLISKAIESCKISLHNCAAEEAELFQTMNTSTDILGRWKINDIQLHFDKQSLVFKHGILSYPYVDIQIGLYVADPKGFYFRALKPIGTYRFIVTLDGEVDDDYLVMDEE
jgi:predicted thioredoxin/glutaredoxin